ncbi:MAG: hypothetical protein GW870_08695 [Deltaproteobacteria bacterium]|nr:hypothetical protein [Deltaproteobacteria bacterium]PIU78257.1 MAG: hypothetical protein COS73_07685 [Nitrospirae bacterium CG06_land_8_20_14_3_00_70_43]
MHRAHPLLLDLVLSANDPPRFRDLHCATFRNHFDRLHHDPRLCRVAGARLDDRIVSRGKTWSVKGRPARPAPGQRRSRHPSTTAVKAIAA